MAKKITFDFDLIVIGSGPGGSAAATIAAKAGKNVAIIEEEIFGGESPNYGEIPTGAVLHAAHLYTEARHGSRFGLRSSTLGYNFPSIQNWKELVVKRTGAGGNRRYYENAGIHVFQGRAHFLSPHEISVSRRHLSAAQFLIATGSKIVPPNIPGIEDVSYLTPRTVLDLRRPPKTVAIVGGGAVGVEIAQLLSSFGTKVVIFEIASRLLPHQDHEVAELMERTLKESYGVSTLAKSKIVAVTQDAAGKKITYIRGGVEKTIRAEEMVIACGRTPDVDLGLDNAHVVHTPKGIEVNEYLQTSVRHIYAAGEVQGKSAKTHTALLESRVVAHNLLNKSKVSPDYAATPHVIATHPGIASVGLSEDQCKKRDLAINKAIAPLTLIPRSNISDSRDGFVKIITDKKGVILGATVVAPHAGEIIHELTLAIKYGLTAAQVAATPHAFLSWSEAVRVAAGKLS